MQTVLSRRQEREARGREDAQQQQQRELAARRGKVRAETEAVGGEAGPSQTKYKRCTYIITDSNEEAIANFVKDYKEFYDKTNDHFKDKARKCLWEKFANRQKLSVKVCKN